jgi:DNA-directed RNA polymerase subunit F
MLEEVYAQIEAQFKVVQERHAKYLEKGNKTAEADVRKALGEIKKLVTPYRAASVESTK